MRITFIVTKLNFNGGGENHDIIMKIRALQEKSHMITVVTVFSKLNSIPKGVSFRVIEEQSPSNKLIGLQIFIVGIFKKYASQTDIFYLIGSSFVFGGGLYRLSTKNSKPVVGDLNGYADFVEIYYKKEPLYPLAYLPEKRSWLRRIKHWLRILLERSFGVYLINHLDAIVILTKTIAQYYIRAGVKKDLITVIPSFYDIISLQQQPLQNNPFSQYPEGTFHILFTGRLHIEKGVDILINAFSQCVCPKAVLHIVGDGPEKAALEKLVNKNDLNKKVIFYPWQTLDTLIVFYQHADLFVHSARLPEPLIRTTVEAMAFGLPLVATDTCGEEWFSKEAAKTFPLGDVNSLRVRLSEAYNDKDFLKRVGHNNKKRAEEFDYRKQIIKLNNILGSIYD